MLKMFPFALGAVLLAGCCDMCSAPKGPVCISSPDGRNTIVLGTDPLAYEVLRDGKVVVAKSSIDMKIDGAFVTAGAKLRDIDRGAYSGKEESATSKKSSIDLSGNWAYADFGDWGVRIVARNDGVAYRFEMAKSGKIKVDEECAMIAVPDSKDRCWYNLTHLAGWEESVTTASTAFDILTDNGGRKHIYLPFSYSHNGVMVLMTESDVRDYPVLYFVRPKKEDPVVLKSWFSGYPLKTKFDGMEKGSAPGARGRFQRVAEHADYLVVTDGKRTFPWRIFMLAEEPSKFCEADIVNALAPAPDKGSDFSWVKPGKVAWDWWNSFDNQGNNGCNTKTYKRFIDFAASNNVEYVIFDEGWSAYLDIWNDSKNVNVPELIAYAKDRGVGIILWMAWAQIVGDERKVAEHFSKLGAKGFKVDFMDRADAAVVAALEKFVQECAKVKMLVDYHGVYRPVGLHRKYPNLINYEGVHGLEQMKWHRSNYDFMLNDIRVFFLRMSAGPMDYTPGAMRNFARGTYKTNYLNPGSYGTRSRQMAMIPMFEAPLQMLCDSPTNYEKNMESFKFMAATPVVWDDTVALGGTPDTFAAIARKGKDGSWYAAGINNWDPRKFKFSTKFLGEGEWKAEIFRDRESSDVQPETYVHETVTVKAGSDMEVAMSGGGGFVIRFSK